jgi:hypothetical protein
MESVYLETTIVGHIAGRMHPDAFVATRQQVTRDWWHGVAPGYELFISQLVIDESSEGDPSAAAERLEVIKDIDSLESSEDVDRLADALIAGKAIPSSEPRDAFHRHFGGQRCKIPVDVELQAHRERRATWSHRTNLPRCRF